VTRRLLIVVGLPVLIGAVVAVPLSLAVGTNQLVFAAIAFGLCVPPGLAVVLLHDYLIRTSPFGRVIALFAGTFIRLAVGFGGGVILFLSIGPDERAEKIAFWLWILFAYLTTLVTETVVFAKPQTPGRNADGRRKD
jgi:hypothetical protein